MTLSPTTPAQPAGTKSKCIFQCTICKKATSSTLGNRKGGLSHPWALLKRTMLQIQLAFSLFFGIAKRDPLGPKPSARQGRSTPCCTNALARTADWPVTGAREEKDRLLTSPKLPGTNAFQISGGMRTLPTGPTPLSKMVVVNGTTINFGEVESRNQISHASLVSCTKN